MSDSTWREVAAAPGYGFAGMTELTIGGRSWQMAGVGVFTRKMLLRHVGRIVAKKGT